MARLPAPVRKRLTEVTAKLFGYGALDQPGVTVHVGVYRQIDGAARPEQLGAYTREQTARILAAGIQPQFRLLFDKRPIRPSRARDGSIAVNLADRQYGERSTPSPPLASSQLVEHFLADFQFRTDPVVDDADALKRVLPFGAKIAAMRPAQRRKLFGSRRQDGKDVPISVDDIPIPEGLEAWRDSFHRWLNDQGTYDADGLYYPKWIARPEPARPGGTDDPLALTDAYLRNTFEPLELQVGGTFLLLASERGHRMLGKIVDSAGRFAIEGLYARQHRVRDTGTPGAITAIVFQAIEGVPWFVPKRRHRVKPTVPLAEATVDPEAMVRALVPRAQIDEHIRTRKLTTADAWFYEMVRMYFPAPMIELETRGIESFSGFSNELMVRAALTNAVADTRGALRERIADVQKQMEGPERSQVVLVRGFPIGSDRILLGLHDGWIYLRDRATGATVRETATEFLLGLRLDGISAEVFARTQGMIPFIKLVSVVVGGVAVGMAIPSFGAWAMRIATYGELSGMPFRSALKRYLRRFLPHLIAAALNGVLCLLPKSNIRTLRMLKGLLHGFAISSTKYWFHSVETTLRDGPFSYRVIKQVARSGGIAYRMYKKIVGLRGSLTDSVTAHLEHRIHEAITSIHRGVVILLDCMLFASYGELAPFLNGRPGGAQPFTNRTYNDTLWQRHQEMIIGPTVLRTMVSVQQLVEASKHGPPAWDQPLAEAIGGVHLQTNFSRAAKATELDKVPHALLLAETLMDMEDGFSIADMWIAAGRSFLVAMSDPDQVEKMGELIGHLLGGMWFDKALFGGRLRLLKSSNPKGFKAVVGVNQGLILQMHVHHGKLTTIFHLLTYLHAHIVSGFASDVKELVPNLADDVKRHITVYDAKLDAVAAADNDPLLRSDPERLPSMAMFARVITEQHALIGNLMHQMAASGLVTDLAKHTIALAGASGLSSAWNKLDLGAHATFAFTQLAYAWVGFGELKQALGHFLLPIAPDSDNPTTLLELAQMVGFRVRDEELDAEVRLDLEIASNTGDDRPPLPRVVPPAPRPSPGPRPSPSPRATP